VTAALHFEHVSFAYGAAPTLDGISFALGPGERVALLGRNGAGKSTLMKLVTGLLRPRAGVVRVGDWDTAECRPEQLARRVGSLFQHADQQLFARTVADDVAFGPRATGVAEPDVAGRVARALAAVGLEAAAGVHPYDLPPAHRKLAALAGVLALESSLLVLDEPTAGLDRRSRARVTAAVAQAAARGAAVLVITHDLGFAAETLDRALVLEAGRLVRDGPLASLLFEPAPLEPLGLVAPPVARLSAALALPDRPVTEADVARALARRCRP
jgi:energy-coupling factor transporter ATP-binding protein EcfA2